MKRLTFCLFLATSLLAACSSDKKATDEPLPETLASLLVYSHRTTSLHSVSLNTAEVKSIYNLGAQELNQADAIRVDPHTGKLIFVSLLESIKVGSPDGKATITILEDDERDANYGVGSIALAGQGRIACSEVDYNSGDFLIRLFNLKTNTSEVIYTVEGVMFGLAVDSLAGNIYWAYDDEVWVGKLDRSVTPRRLFTESQVSEPMSLHFNQSDKRIYFHTAESGSIISYKADGTDRQVLYRLARPDLDFINDMALDEKAGRVYFTTNMLNSPIYSVKTDGTGLDSIKAGLGSSAGIWIIR